jgi:hypothetical protein
MANISVGAAQALSDLAGGGTNGGLTQEQAARFLSAAVLLVNRHKVLLSKPVVAVRTRNGGRRVTGRSSPGEYPRADTGMLRNAITIDPKTTLEEVMRTAHIKVGIRRRAWYGAYLEVVYQRLGLSHTLRNMLPQLQAIAGMPLRFVTAQLMRD